MDTDIVMERLQSLQRDLIAFSESRLPTVERLFAELDASVEDLRELLSKKSRSDESRKQVNPSTNPNPNTLKIEDVEYSVNEEFRQTALVVADELDLDEIQAAKLCIQAKAATDGLADFDTPYRALLRFQNRRAILLECVRLLLKNADDAGDNDQHEAKFRDMARRVVCGESERPDGGSAFWRKCMDGLVNIELYIKKVEDNKQTVLMTGISLPGAMEEAIFGQRYFLVRQHESMASIMTHLTRGRFTAPEDFRALLSKTASLEGPLDVTIHYLPILISAAARFGADETTTLDAANDLHRLFATGPGQLQWKQPHFKGAATICWLANYSSRFADATKAQTPRVADRQKAEEDRSALFNDSIKLGAFQLLLSTCRYLQPEVWHNPAKVGLVRYLLPDDHGLSEISASKDFALHVMTELQLFCSTFIEDMPNVLRKLRVDDDNRRRAHFSNPETSPDMELHYERFLVIVAYAYQDQPEAAQDFWNDKEGGLYGFLQWASSRLSTPRVAAFCELLRSISSDEKSGNQTHRFLLEESSITSGKPRKTQSVSWSQIFSELEIYAASVKNQPVPAAASSAKADVVPPSEYIELETEIMLEAYMRLASHVCRTSPEARNWLLREQNFHLGETLFYLAASGDLPRIHANCFELLSAMLTDKVSEVNDGTWVLLDNWISSGSPAGPSSARPHSSRARALNPEKHYLQSYADNFETATGLVALLDALVAPVAANADTSYDMLPFPETLGAPNRHAGIDAYVDFVLGPVFKSTHPSFLQEGQDILQVDVLRYCCLQFICLSLSTFNEDLAALANVSNVSIDSNINTTSLATYIRLHPFSRVMDWMLNNNVISSLASCVEQDVDHLNTLDFESPCVQAAVKAVEAMDLAMKTQATYFDIVRPHLRNQSGAEPTLTPANTAFASYDEVMLSQLNVIANVACFVGSTHTDLSLAAIRLMQKLCSSRSIGDGAAYAHDASMRVSNRLVGKLSTVSDLVGVELGPNFDLFPWDLENEGEPLKLVKANAVLDMLSNSLSTSAGRPGAAHCLLGFACQSRTVTIGSESAFSRGTSLFHQIVRYAAASPLALDESNVSWLLSAKRGCYEVIMKLALSPLSSSIVLPELRGMDFLAAASQNQVFAATSPHWDQKPLNDPHLLLDSSATAVRDFMRVRELFFEFAALELRTANETRSFSVQDRIINALLGTLKLSSGEDEPTLSIFDLFDFFDLQTEPASDVACKYFHDVDLSSCVKEDDETEAAFDLNMAELLLTFQKRELSKSGMVKDTQDDQEAAEDEMRAILASLKSQNNWRSIQAARISALEAWADLLALVATTNGAQREELAPVALQGLQAVLPRFEKTLPGNLDAAALLAKLTLTLVPAATSGSSEQRTITLAQDRLMSAFRVCLKAITDSGTDLALRDVCYRTCCSVLASLQMTVVNGKTAPSQNARQLLQLIQNAGDRLVTVITEDVFSGRGVTRIASLLFLDSIISLFQLAKDIPSMLRALTKLNFVPVLIDQSIGNVTTTFQADNDEIATTVAFFHTSLSLLLNLCQTPEGTQLVLTSGFFAGVADSRLFSTDPDIGLDIDNPAALKEFYRLLSAVLRVVTAVVMSRGPNNAAILQQANGFLQQSRFSMQAVFKRTSALKKTSGPPEVEAVEVAEEFERLIFVTGFLEEDESTALHTSRANGFT